MNTTVHALLGVALLARGERRIYAASALLGSLVPDLPMFVFFAWERFAVGLPDSQIWSEAYFRAPWQAFFDLFNSLPLIGIGWLVARRLDSPRGKVFAAGALFHCLCDLPLHREDAHRHFYPLSHWRFVSPVSYWDPAHHAVAWSALESVVVLAAAWLLWWRFRQRGARALVTLACGLTFLSWLVLYAMLDGGGFQ